MPITIKQNTLKYKDPTDGEYHGMDAVSDHTTSESVALIQQTGASQLSTINARATEIQAELPKVAEMEAMVAGSFVSGSYEEGDYVIQPDNGVNKLYRFKDDHSGDWTGLDVDEVKLSDDFSILIKAFDPATVDETTAYLDVAGGSEPVDEVVVTGSTPVISAMSNTMYVCGTVTTLDFTPNTKGLSAVQFTSGSTPTVLTVPNTVVWPAWFDPTDLEASTVYEISIRNGVYGMVATWA